MDCRQACEHLGAWLDGELPSEQARALEAHLSTCPACTQQHDQLADLLARLHQAGEAADVRAPAALWDGIEPRMSTPRPRAARRHRLHSSARRLLAMAAGVAVLIGGITVATFLLNGSTRVAHAEAIDYSLLLNGLNEDVDAAITRFITYYRATPISPEQAVAVAPGLSFALPTELPHGYTRERVFSLRFGGMPGIAGIYRRGREPLVALFHPPICHEHEEVGSHSRLPCIIDGRHGDQVEVGPWRLVHFTDPSTCHCVLSTLDPDTQLPDVMAAVAPLFPGARSSPTGHSPAVSGDSE